MNDALMAEVRKKLYSGVISYVLDTLGNMHQAMAPKIRPLDETLVMFNAATAGTQWRLRGHPL